ncbi:hypothetical protein [Phenylobacterium sp.]|uniref:hypothetical protein n=1 Tax=Phenylobacterium sp. TaxID=1871053 RepID=UPI0035B0280B
MMHSALAALAILAAAPQAADPPPAPKAQETTVCLDVGGHSVPAVCHVYGGLGARDEFCLCPEGRRVTAPVCGPGETAPAETRAYDKARLKAAEDGSLIGDLYEGKPMCVNRDYLPKAP